MATETRKPDSTEAQPASTEDQVVDGIAEIPTLPLVKSFSVVTQPVLRETLRKNDARPQMRTMSDMGKNGDKGGFERGVAKSPKRP
jgi:hypothetical protein